MKAKTIWKFTLPQENDFEIEMPAGATIVHIQEQNSIMGQSGGIQMCLWAEVDPDAAKETRRFAIYGTGHDFRHDSQIYRGTLFYGPLVFHVYEVLG